MAKKGWVVGLIVVLGLVGFIPVRAASTTIVINEVEYDAIQSGTDTTYEWFELYNKTGSPITLTGWTITDNTTTNEAIPTVTVPANGYVVVAATAAGFSTNYPGFSGTIVYMADGSVGNGLANGGDRLILKDNTTAIIDQISWGSNTTALNPSIPVVAAGHSSERVPTGYDTDVATDFVNQYTPTPGGTDTTSPMITAVASSGITGASATITWMTNELSDSSVYYRIKTPPGTWQSQSNANRVTSHSVNLSGLNSGTTYEYYVTSTDAFGNSTMNNNGGSYYTFTTTGSTVVTVSTPTVTYNGPTTQTIDITGVTASCSVDGAITGSSGTYTVYDNGGTSTGIKGAMSWNAGSSWWEALGVNVSSLTTGTYYVRVVITDNNSHSGTSGNSSTFTIILTIAQAKAKSNGTTVTVRGYVTAPKGVFSNSEMYIQDKTAGIKIYMEGSGIPGTVNLGDLVEVAGIIMSHKREREIHASEFINLGPGSPPLPSSLSTAACMLETNEGLLVSVTSAKVTSTGGGRFFIDDGSGPACVYIDYDTGINLSLYSGFGRGAIVRVTGVAGQYNSVHEIKPRFKEDILVLFPAPPPSVYNAEIPMKNMSYAAATNIEKVEALLNRAENLLRLAAEKELDTSGCDFLISEAERQIKRAKEVSQTNFIAANNFALKASVLLREAIRCLEALLG